MPKKKRARLPWLKYWSTDWFSDMALQSCSIAARGLWHEMILFMHMAPIYGHMVNADSEAITDDKIASLFHVAQSECSVYLIELESAVVFSRTCTGIIYSRRMLRDDKTRAASRKRQQFHRHNTELRHANVTPLSQLGNAERLEAEAKRLEAYKPKSKATTAQAPLPEWLDTAAWNDFRLMRQKIRKPMTGRAEVLLIQKLDALRQLGQDPKAVLEQSICNSWQGVFPLKVETNGDGKVMNATFATGQREADRTRAEAVRRMG